MTEKLASTEIAQSREPLIWEKTGKRMYRCDAAEFNAVLFGATEPAQLWAWSIWWKGGQASAVQTKFADAKNQADKNIALIIHGIRGKV